MTVRIGKYGTFVQIGTRDDEEKPRFAGLLPGQKLDTITFDEAMALFDLPRDLGETSEGEESVPRELPRDLCCQRRCHIVASIASTPLSRCPALPGAEATTVAPEGAWLA